eukprot:11205562-Lingulodinium_polyedra.AAC.1
MTEAGTGWGAKQGQNARHLLNRTETVWRQGPALGTRRSTRPGDGEYTRRRFESIGRVVWRRRRTSRR